MSIKKGSTAIVDRYKGSQLVEKVYKGQTKIFDAYTDVSGALPLSFTARAQQALKNYRLYGTSEGSGVETESGEPEGYKIPLTLTSGQNIDTYPLYIGSTKLGAEEYVDYQEQKVWKYGANVYDKDDSSMHYGPGYAIENTTSKWTVYEGSGHTWRVPCLPNTKYRIRIPNAAPIFKVATARTGNIPTLRPIKAVDVYDLFIAPEAISEFVYTTDDSALYIVLQFSASEATAITENLSVQALQPTDPPAPFPAFQAYKGENTLSSTETVGSVTVTGRISEIPEP